MTMHLRADAARLDPTRLDRTARRDDADAPRPKLGGQSLEGWDELERRINDRGNGMSTFIGLVRPGHSKLDLVDRPRGGSDDPAARPGHSWDVDPDTGRIVQEPDVRPAIWTSEDQERQDRGWNYGVDPDTGEIVREPNGPRPAIWTSEDQQRQDRGWIYELDPDTGEIVQVPTGPTPLRAH